MLNTAWDTLESLTNTKDFTEMAFNPPAPDVWPCLGPCHPSFILWHSRQAQTGFLGFSHCLFVDLCLHKTIREDNVATEHLGEPQRRLVLRSGQINNTIEISPVSTNQSSPPRPLRRERYTEDPSLGMQSDHLLESVDSQNRTGLSKAHSWPCLLTSGIC